MLGLFINKEMDSNGQQPQVPWEKKKIHSDYTDTTEE